MTTPLLVSVDWLTEHYSMEDLQVLDTRMLSPDQKKTLSSEAEYCAGHLPGAPFFNIEALSDHTSPYPHMMPRAEDFALAMRGLGVNSNHHLVVYDAGNLFSAPRAWWMLSQFGAERVSILSGGLAAWRSAGLPVQSGAVTLSQGNFTARAVAEAALKNLTDVVQISHKGGAQLVDARAANRFRGEVDEPRTGLWRGHIPGALNVPWNELVENGRLKTDAQLHSIFAAQGVDVTQPVVASCGSGITAAVLLLALTQLGAHQLSLYDGSWSEWGSRDDLPGVDLQHRS